MVEADDTVRFFQDGLENIFVTDLVGQLVRNLELFADDLVGVVEDTRHVEQERIHVHHSITVVVLHQHRFVDIVRLARQGLLYSLADLTFLRKDQRLGM